MIPYGDGPSGETRTRGILLPKQARYQLRYTRILKMYYTPLPRKKQPKNVEKGICIFCSATI